MCALTVALPVSPDSFDDSSWTSRAARLRVEGQTETRALSLSFRDMSVRAEDVTTVHEALSHCSVEGLLGAVMRHEAGWRIPVDAVGSRARHMLMGRIGCALDAMRSLEDAAVGLSPSREGIIGPLFRFASAEGSPGLEHRVEAALLSFHDSAAIEERLGSGMRRVCTWDELRTLRCGSKSPATSDPLSPESLRGSLTLLSRMPWERALALPLWLPCDLSEDEREAILAKVFWSMTYRGFAQCEVQPSASSALSISIEEARRSLGSDVAPWPADPVIAVLDHNCWVDTLEAWNTLFAVISRGETRL